MPRNRRELLVGAVLFSTKAVVAKLIYRYHVDAVTLIGFRMLFSLPFFAAVALWHAQRSPHSAEIDMPDSTAQNRGQDRRDPTARQRLVPRLPA